MPRSPLRDRLRQKRAVLIALLAPAVALGACLSFGDLSGGGIADGGGADGALRDGAISDGGIADAIPDSPPAVYSQLFDPTKWSTFDTTTVNPGAVGFRGAAFDGRYIYLVPGQNGATAHGIVTRYDTQADFDTGSAWLTFDVMNMVDTKAAGFAGAIFDGHYLYFVPDANTMGGDGVVARYDTQMDFGTKSSWLTFNASTVPGGPGAFIGGAFDGRYIYFSPWLGSVVARYDTQGSFTAAWLTFNTATLDASPSGFGGAVFDGHYVYFVPRYNYAVSAANPIATRYDTTSDFASAGSWSTFDIAKVNPGVSSFVGGAFDGRYVYFAPNSLPVNARYDTTLPFAADASWETYGGGNNSTGTVFDGRYVYFVPFGNGLASGARSDIERFDTLGDYDAASSWFSFDVSMIQSDAKGFYGGAFDGRYVYFVPAFGSIVARFDAKVPASMPSTYHGSFL